MHTIHNAIPEDSINKFFEADEIQERTRVARERYAYEQGFRDGLNASKDDSEDDLLWAKFAAELFIDVVNTLKYPIKIKQARIGHDPSGDVPTAFFLVAPCDAETRRVSMGLSRKLERAIRKHFGKVVHIWTYGKETYDREMIASDFPFYRTQN